MEILGGSLNKFLQMNVGWQRVLDEPALTELLALLQGRLHQCDADTAAEVTRDVDQCCRLVGVVAFEPGVRRRRDRNEEDPAAVNMRGHTA